MTEAPRDAHAWRAAWICAVVVTLMGMAWTLMAWPAVLGTKGWATPLDAWIPMQAAHFIGNGAYLYQYEAGPFQVATPMLPLVLAPLAALGDALALTEAGPPIPATYPSMWLIYGPLMMLASVTLFHVARVIDTRWGNSAGPSPAAAQVMVGLLAVVPLAVVYGHFEDMFALVLVLWCLVLSSDGKPMAAGIAMGVAIGFKQWALMGVPLLLVRTAREHRAWVGFWSLFVPAALVAGPLIFDREHSWPALFGSVSWPNMGRHQLWVTPGPGGVGRGPGGVVLLLAAAGMAAWFRDRDSLSQVLGAFGTVFLLRMLVEPTVFAYYLAPGLVFLLLAERARGGSGWHVTVAGSAMFAWFAVRPPLPAWWIVFWSLLVVLCLPALRDLTSGRNEAGADTRAG